MLERIHRVKGIGLLHDANGQTHKFQKATFIYADNGRGKSTLASLLRSCSTNNPALVVNRRTIDGTNNQEVEIQFSHGEKSKFQNGSWDKSRPEILVFDSDFVEQNVYAGGQVSTEQRKNLLKFAIGANAVVAQREYDQADQELRDATANVRDITSQLAIAHQGKTLVEFKQILEVPDVDEQITTLNRKIAETRNVRLIEVKALPQLLQLPSIDVNPIIAIMGTSIANIDLAAEKQVKVHLDSHQKHGLEIWISNGQGYIESENCPFCDQSLKGIEIIQAYQSYFNQEYQRLKSNVARLENLINKTCTDSIIDSLKSQFETASAIIDGWQEHLEIIRPAFNEVEARGALSNIRHILEALKQHKESNLLEAVSTDEMSKQIDKEWQVIINSTRSCNDTINNALQRITQYKESLIRVNIEQLEQQIKELDFAKIRFRPDVVDLLNQLSVSQQAEIAAQIKKQTKKNTLNQVMQTTLDSYKGRINELLRSFGAQFFIPTIDFDYRGGLRSDYSLEMRGANIALSGGIPDFKTSLSEGDKRTLAFAFFIALTEADSDLVNKIIIIDDPMCSFDLNRKQQTRTVLKRLYDSSKQLVIIAHDIHFLRNLRDDIQRTAGPTNIKFLRLRAVTNRYSDFGDIDIDQECESAYFKSHRLLDEYITGNAQSSMEVARTIRPMLEGYLHRRFPGRINSGLLFGEVVNQINNAQHPCPLVHAQNIINELNEINRYAGQFHHDTNPAADQVQVVDSELLIFVERAINIVHVGRV
jgi:wobble nucleotide-excising tRNase